MVPFFADTEGFEPPVLVQYACFQDKCVRPLRHVSIVIFMTSLCYETPNGVVSFDRFTIRLGLVPLVGFEPTLHRF